MQSSHATCRQHFILNAIAQTRHSSRIGNTAHHSKIALILGNLPPLSSVQTIALFLAPPGWRGDCIDCRSVLAGRPLPIPSGRIDQTTRIHSRHSGCSLHRIVRCPALDQRLTMLATTYAVAVARERGHVPGLREGRLQASALPGDRVAGPGTTARRITQG